MCEATRKRHFPAGATETELGSKVSVGAGIGGTLGAVAAAIAAVGTSVIFSGIGLVVAGPLAAGITGAGGVAGGLVGALVGSGIPDERVSHYDAGVKDGGSQGRRHFDGRVAAVRERRQSARKALEEQPRRACLLLSLIELSLG